MNDQQKFSELLHCFADFLREGDLEGHLQAWMRVCSGEVTPETPAPRPTRDKESIALDLAAAGGVTSSELASHTHHGNESARLLLAKLAREGKLLPRGVNRGRYYVLAPDYQAGRIRDTGGTPSVPAGGKR